MNKISRYIGYFKDDASGALGLVYFLIKRNIIRLLYSYNTFKLRLKGCSVGNGCMYLKSPYVVRFPNSKISIGDNVYFVSCSSDNFRGINHRCIISTGCENAVIRIGNYCGMSGCSIVADREVVIGNHVTIGANTIIGDRDDHPELFHSEPASIIIEDNVWIGMNCIILKGVHVGRNSIIGAGSIVTKDIPSNTIAAGVPCHIIRNRDE